MMAFWTRRSLHQGKSTLLGRILAGSHAISAHHAAGQALFVADHPPDRHLSPVMIAYCPKGVEATGITRCGIDRAVHAVAMAGAFDPQGGGRLCLLDDHEPHGLDRVDATPVGARADGTRVSSGPWKVPRHAAPRHVVIVEPAAGQTLVYWGTPKGRDPLEASEWPQGERARSERQEHRCKRLMDHGALKTNDGRKQIVGPDRHPQRAREQRDQALEGLQPRVDKQVAQLKTQQDKVAEAASNGHGTRLAQRQRTLAVWAKERKAVQHTQGKLVAHAAALGPPGERAERDCRTQTRRTLRTLLLENALRACMVVLLGRRQTPRSLARVLHLLFERSGARRETATQVV